MLWLMGCKRETIPLLLSKCLRHALLLMGCKRQTTSLLVGSEGDAIALQMRCKREGLCKRRLG